MSEDEDGGHVSPNNVHVHLSDKFEIKYNHLLTWFLPQLRNKEGNELEPLDAGIGRVTNGVKTVGQGSRLLLTTSLYNVVIVLDMSASMFTVDMDHNKVIIEELDEALRMCIRPLFDPEIEPWLSDPSVELDVNLTVLAYTPQFKNRFISVLIQSYPLNSTSSELLTEVLEKRCAEIHKFIKKSDMVSSLNVKPEQQTKNDRCGLHNLVGEVLNILKIQRSRQTRGDDNGEGDYDNSKNVMIMITDGVLGDTSNARQIVHSLHERTTSCSFVRVGPCDPGHYGFGYIPNISLLNFIAEVSGGRYWDWGAKHEMRVEQVFQWSPFTDPPDTRGLVQKKVEYPCPIQTSLTSTITKKIFEGFKISEVNVRSQGLAPDFSGSEITTLHVTMSLTWRKRVHLTYELVTDLPIEPYSIQKIPKVKVTVCVYSDYEIINGLAGDDDKHRTSIKLLDQFKRFVSEQLRPHEEEGYDKRWIYELHNYSCSGISRSSLDLTASKSEPHKIERALGTATPDSEMIRFNKFWLHLIAERDFIDGHFDVYQLKCWLQFDLNLPKCLTGVSRSNKNHNKEFQIYSRSHGFLLDVLFKWSNIVIDKEVYIQLYETKTTADPKHSFVWVTVKLSTCASMCIYIAMHRDIPFQEQHDIRQDLVLRLMRVKFPGSLLLDSGIKVGQDTTLKRRGGSFIPFNLKADFACQQIPKNIDEMISWNIGSKREDLYLHKLKCTWKTCPDVNCCSDELIKDLRNEVFNALFRLRLQEDFRPLNVSGKVFSCFQLLQMRALPNSSASDVTCLLQYVITVDDEAVSEKKDQRKISPNFTTEIIIEPQWGMLDCPSGNLTHLHGLEFNQIPPGLFEGDFQLITSLCSFATVKKMCSLPEKVHQPSFSSQTLPLPTSLSEPCSTTEMQYLFLVSTLLKRSILNVVTLPLISVLPDEDSLVEGEESEPSPNTALLRSLCELLEVSFSRHIPLSASELGAIKKNVKARFPAEAGTLLQGDLPETHWKCFVRFSKLESGKEDKTRLQFVLVPEPPENYTDDQMREYFPGGQVHLLVFDCFYKVLLGTFTNPQRCSLDKLYASDKFLSDISEIEDLPCPELVSEIIEESTATQTNHPIETLLKFKHIGQIAKMYEKSYMLGVHFALVQDIPVDPACVHFALRLLEKPRLLDLHVKTETKHVSLSRYLSAVCSHLSGQASCCRALSDTSPLNASMDSSDREATSECYNADADEGNSTTVCAESSRASALDSEEDQEAATPCQTENRWTRVVSTGLSLGGQQGGEVWGSEIVSASSTEMTPIIGEKRFEDSLRAMRLQINEQNVDIDNDSSSSQGDQAPTLDVEPKAMRGGELGEYGEGEEEKSTTLTREKRQLSDGESIDVMVIGKDPQAPNSLKSPIIRDTPQDPLLDLRRVSFLTSTPPDPACPLINIQSSTPTQEPPSSSKPRVLTEQHANIQAKFDEIVDCKFLRMTRYTDEYLVMRTDSIDSTESTERPSVLFMKMSCVMSLGEESRTVTTLPTCILHLSESEEFKKRRESVEMVFTCFTLPVIVPSPPIYRSPTHSFINTRPAHRRKDSYRKSDQRSSDKRSSTPLDRTNSVQVLRSCPNLDDTDEGEFPGSVRPSSRLLRDQVSLSPASSTPNLSRQTEPGVLSLNPVNRRGIEDMYEEVRWLIEDQCITHLRTRSPVTHDTLKQVIYHCKNSPAALSQNCMFRHEELSYVESWEADRLWRHESRHEEKLRHDEEKARHEELLARVVLASEFELFSLCRIENFFYYALKKENEQKELSGREVLSAQSSISSLGSRPSLHYSTSSSSLQDDLPMSMECNMRPCSKYWIVVEVQLGSVTLAYHTADTGLVPHIDSALLNKIVNQILHLNKIQNQEQMLEHMEQSKVCPRELLPDHWLAPSGQYINTYVCEVVHHIVVQLWDKDEHEGLRDIKESLFNFKCDNQDEFVYYYIQDAIHDRVRSTFYFQLPKPSNKKSKKLSIEVRGLQSPDADKQQTFDNFVQLKLEEAKLEDIALRLYRNNQAKLTAEEVAFLSNNGGKSGKSRKALYVKIPPFVYDFLPHFWFFLDQHLQQQQDLFCPRYDGKNEERIQFENENTGESETTKDTEVFIKLRIGSRTGHEGRYAGGRVRIGDTFFQSLVLVNATIVDPSNNRVDFKDRWFNHKSPAFENEYKPPSASQFRDIKPTTKLDEHSRLSLKLRVIEKRKKAGSQQRGDRELEFVENSLFPAIQAAFTSLLMEVYILPAELTVRQNKASAIVACVDDDSTISISSMTPKQYSSSLGGSGPGSGSAGKNSGGILGGFMSRSRRNSNDSLDTLRDVEFRERLRRKMPTSSSKDDNSSLHYNLREPCIEACELGSKTKIIEKHYMQLPSIFVSNQVINKVIDGLSPYFKVRIFGQDTDYKMIPPTCHTEEEIENSKILLVARRLTLWNDSRVTLQGSDMSVRTDEKPVTEQLLALEAGYIEVKQERLDVPRQMHIVVLLHCKRLTFYLYNVHKQLARPFMESVRGLVAWLNTRKMLLTRLLLLKTRRELPPHFAQSGLLPNTSKEIEETFVERKELPTHQMTVVMEQRQQQSTFESKNAIQYYEQLYDHYHPGSGAVSTDPEHARARDPIVRHCNQLSAYMRAAERANDDQKNKVDLDDPELPSTISREQAKLLKKNARLLHFIASPLLFSIKLKSSAADKETFSYMSSSPNDKALEEPAWFLHFKNQLFEKFIAYLRDPARGIRMTLKYQPRGLSREVDISNTLNYDDNEALLSKESPGGGRILLGVLIQNSTFCVKLYGFDSDSRLRLFQECNNLKAHTHTNSFNYDFMVQSIYDSLIAHKEGARVKQILPIHHCVQSVVRHYESVAEPPHTRCWIKDFTITENLFITDTHLTAEGLFDYMVQNQEDLGVFTIPGCKKAGSKRGEETKLLVLVPQDLGQDPHCTYKFAIIVSEVVCTDNGDNVRSPRDFGLSFYIILVNQYLSTPPGTLLREQPYIRTRNESRTTVSSASSPGSIADDLSEIYEYRPRINSQIFSAYEAKQKLDLYRRAKNAAVAEIKELLQLAQKSYNRDVLIQKLIRPPSSKLELSYHGFLKDDFTSQNLQELIDLSYHRDLLEKGSSIRKLLQNWTYSRYKKLLDFLRNKLDILIILDDDKTEIGIITKKIPVSGRSDKTVIVILRLDKSQSPSSLGFSAVVKSDHTGTQDTDHVAFWEKILSLVCVYIWERMVA